MKKIFKEARANIKSGSGQENTEQTLLEMLSQPTITMAEKAEGYYLCALLQQSVNEGLNMQAYLKQNVDTNKIYNSILNVYNYTLRSDSADEYNKYANKNQKLRNLHRANLLGGGKYFLRKSPYFDMFLCTRTTDMDSIVGRVAYWSTICGMNSNNPQNVLKHVDTAISLANSFESSALAEYKARSVLHLGDSAQWINILEDGVDRYPGYNYFFLNLMDYYMRHGQIDRGLAKTDSLVRTDGDRALYWFAMSMFALAQGDYEECIAMSDECLQRDSDNVDALYNKGISLLNMALTEKMSAKRRLLYRRALEPMERVRQLLPDDIAIWGNPLYRIYLNLNMGKKFDEIDTLLELHHMEVDKSDSKFVVPSNGTTTSSESLDKRFR